MQIIDAIGNHSFLRGGDTVQTLAGIIIPAKNRGGGQIHSRPENSAHSGKLYQDVIHQRAVWVYDISRSGDFGTITQPKTISFYIRNASDSAQTLLSLGLDENSGISLSGISAGDTLKSEEWRKLVLEAGLGGNAEINANLELKFEAAVIKIELSGVRAVIFSYLPNFEYTESKELKTDVFLAQNGRERRVRNRGEAIRKLRFAITTAQIEQNAGVRNLLSYAMKTSVFVPLYFSSASATADSRGASITCDSLINKEFIPGGFAILRRSFSEVEFFKIEDIKGNTLKINKAIKVKRGEQILPLIKATPSYSTSYDFINGAVGKYELSFKEL